MSKLRNVEFDTGWVRDGLRLTRVRFLSTPTTDPAVEYFPGLVPQPGTEPTYQPVNDNEAVTLLLSMTNGVLWAESWQDRLAKLRLAGYDICRKVS